MALSNNEKEEVKIEPEFNDVEITQENVKCIIMDGYEYCFNTMVDNAQRWMCANASCYAYFEILYNKLVLGAVGHCHSRETEFSSGDVQSKSAMPEQMVPSSAKIVRNAKRHDGKKPRCSPKCKKAQLRNKNSSDDSCSVPSSVKKKLARQWTLDSDFAANLEFDRVGLDQNTREAPSTSGSASFKPESPEISPPTMESVPSPAKSPKLSEVGPPPTPPPSEPSPLSQLEDPGTPGLPAFDLSELKFTAPTDSDYDFYQPSPNWDFPQDESPHVASSPRLSPSEDELSKYKEYEDMMMQLDHKGFGNAVTSLLTELSTRSANEVRSEIAAVLYRAVEGYTAKVTRKPEKFDDSTDH